jgi:hypothetical protein
MSDFAKDNNTMAASWQLYDAERMANESLRQQLAEKDAELVKWQRRAWEEKSKHLASQAREQQLLELLRLLPETVIAEQPEWDASENNGIIWQLYLSRVCGEALALPQDTAALSAMIAKAGEVMRERCAVECEQRQMAYATAGYERHAQATAGLSDDIRALPGVTLKDLK